MAEPIKSGLGEISVNGEVKFLDGKSYDDVKIKVHESSAAQDFAISRNSNNDL